MAISTAAEIIALKLPSSATDPRLADFISLAGFYVSERIFEDKYQYALALVVCHQLALESQGGGSAASSGSGAVGGIKSEKEGDLARSFGGVGSNISEQKQYFMSTPFGQELLQLWNACILMPRNRYVNGR